MHRCSQRRHTLPPLPPPRELNQATLSDVWLVPPPGELDKTRRFWFWPIQSIRPYTKNMTSSTKPQVGLHNVLHCRQRRTEPRSHVTCTENFEKFGQCDIWDASRQTQYTQTNGHRNMLTAVFCIPTGGKVIIYRPNKILDSVTSVPIGHFWILYHST